MANGNYFYPDTATTLQEEPRLINVPLPQGTTPEAYLAAFDTHVVPGVRAFAPDLILISCGFDACAGDSPAHPDGYLQLDPNAYAELTRRMIELAAECSQGRLVSLFEGGYKQKPLAACARAHVASLAGLGDYCFAAHSPTREEKALAGEGRSDGGGFAVGARVMCRYQGKRKEYPGKIVKARPDGTYDIKYDDGDQEAGVKAELLKPAKHAGAAAAATKASAAAESAAAAAPAAPNPVVPTTSWQCMKCLTTNDAGVERCKVFSCNVPFVKFGLLQGDSHVANFLSGVAFYATS